MTDPRGQRSASLRHNFLSEYFSSPIIQHRRIILNSKVFKPLKSLSQDLSLDRHEYKSLFYQLVKGDDLVSRKNAFTLVNTLLLLHHQEIF